MEQNRSSLPRETLSGDTGNPVADGQWAGIPLSVMGLLALAVLIATSIYTVGELRTAGEIGFPLDDTWIHMVFARNLAEGYGFSYNPGVPVAGSTAPLWTLLLAASEFIPGGAFIWAKIWGVLFLWLTGLLVYRIARFYLGHGWQVILLGLTTVCTPRMVWAGLSGMEVTLFTSLSLLALYLHITGSKTKTLQKHITAALFALATLTRPEGIVVFLLVLLTDGLALACQGMTKKAMRWRISLTLSSVSLYAVILLPTILFNLRSANVLTPTTFPAMVGQHGLVMALISWNPQEILRSITSYPLQAIPSLLIYWGSDNLLFLPLLPMGLLSFLSTRRGRPCGSANDDGRWRSLALPLVLIGLPIFRAIIVPSQNLNHHMGRYIAPITPLYIIICGIGLSATTQLDRRKLHQITKSPFFAIVLIASAILSVLLFFGEGTVTSLARVLYELRQRSIPLEDRWPMVQALYRTWVWAILFLTVNLGALRAGLRRGTAYQYRTQIWFGTAFFLAVVGTLLHIPIYAGQVKNIQEIQVAMGRWAASATPPDALLATNDIGAITYFSEREILDIMGLVSPEIIPLLESGEKGLIEGLAERQPDYLIIFPNWYPRISGLQPLLVEVHRVTTKPNLISGGSTMIAYRANWDHWPEARVEIDNWK